MENVRNEVAASARAPLCEFEVQVLRAAAGQDVPGLIWGAAMGAAIEELRSRGLVTGNIGDVRATACGYAWLASYDAWAGTPDVMPPLREPARACRTLGGDPWPRLAPVTPGGTRSAAAWDALRELERADALQRAGKFPKSIAMCNDFEALSVLTEEVGEVAHEVNETIGTPWGTYIGEVFPGEAEEFEAYRKRLRTELIQVAAMTIGWAARLGDK